MTRKGSLFSLISVFIVVLVGLILALTEGRYKKSIFLAYDAFGYYSYLPATFIHDDIHFTYLEDLPEEYRLNHYHGTVDNGRKYQFYTFGVALLELPGFIAAMIHAKLMDIEVRNGLSPPFPLYIVFSTIIWLLIGLIFLRAFLLNYFSDVVTAITLICVGIGTNLIYYSSHEAGMSHIFSFAFICMFISLTHKYYEKNTNFRIILLGITLGIITLIRIPNILVGLFFVLYGVVGVEDLKVRFTKLLRNWKDMLVIAVFVAFFIACQIFLWYYQTGYFFINGYNMDIYIDVHFEWLQPHILDGLFSYKKGWLLYTPIMGFSIIGIAFLFKSYKGLAVPVVSYTVLVIYVLFSWEIWWYGGSFGMRSMIDSYGLFAIPFAAFVAWVTERKWLLRISTLLLALFFIYLNMFQIKQYLKGSIHWENMSKEAYWSVFLTKKVPDNFEDLLEP